MPETRLQKIEEILADMKAPAYRLKQVKHAIYQSGTEKYSEISTLPRGLIEALSKNLGDEILSLKNIHEIEADQTQKILFETSDKHRIETVRMLFKPTEERDSFFSSLCISSQSGCTLGCKFCATGAIGFKKNLSADEISDQVLYFKKRRLPVDSVAFMGMGEPFANPSLWDALKILTAEDLIGLSRHKISVSTVGIIPGIERLIEEFPQINLAFSLHTPFNDQRAELMPITKAYPIKDVMESVKKYVLTTNNKVFIAYALMEGLNDSLEHAKALTDLIKKQGPKSYLYHINLIRYNPGPGVSEFKRPNPARVNKFMDTLTKEGLKVTLKQNFGLDIYAACGQLYGKYEKREVSIDW